MADEYSAGIVVFRKTDEGIRYLLLHYKYKSEYWGFAKGNIEESEDEKTTAERETKEETGLDVEIVEGFEERISWFYKRGGRTILKESVFFLAEAKTGEVEISEEHIGHAWLKYEKAFEQLKFKNSQDVLKKAHNFLHK